MTSTPDMLVKRCDAVFDGAGRAIGWVDDVRADSGRLDRDADGLIERLRRARNAARRLGGAAARPMAVGFFGLSQAGKSYLISALARGVSGAVETVMEGRRLNFISHINPPGGGKEATGIVTRFTRQAEPAPAGFPVSLALFSEADLIKILGNSFFMDFDAQRVAFCTDHGEIRAHLARLAKTAQAGETGGMTADDVVDVMDYFVRRFPKSMEAYVGDFWPTATELAPRLAPRDRADLFSLLWGGIEELTAAYLRLREGLARLGHAPRAFAELGALVKDDGAGGFTQADSIMNVDMLSRIGRDDADLVQVVPLDGGRHNSVGMPRSLLAALAREMALPLADPPEEGLLATVDLLDFPGYRGRLNVANLKEVAEKLENRDPVAELILRGKVAYLFERYTDDQEMNVLVMCTPCHKQSDVNDLGPALEAWIASTQGETPEDRSRRLPGLVWAITMFDARLAPRPDETEDLIRTGWPGMMRLTLLEKFEQFEWVNAWTPGKPFDNLFLVRKPGMAAGVIRSEDRREVAVETDQVSRLALLRRTFVEDAAVARHVADPAAAWDAMMTLDDGGMAALSSYLEKVARREVKLDRIAELVDKITRDLIETQLGGYYRAEGADEVKRKQALAAKAVSALRQRPGVFGELLSLLQPSLEHVRSLYLRAEAEAEDAAVGALIVDPFASGGLVSLDIGGGMPGPGAAGNGGGRAAVFAKAVISDWVRQLRALPDNAELHRRFGLSAEVLQIIVDEVIAGADRTKVEKTLVDALRDAEDRAGTTRGRLADQQMLVACTAVCDYVDGLGLSDVPLDRRPESTAVAGRRLFAPPPRLSGLPTLTPAPLNYSAYGILDWMDAFAATAVGNAGHAAGSEINPEQNQRLGAILARIAGDGEQGTN